MITWVSSVTHTATDHRDGVAYVASYSTGLQSKVLAIGYTFDATTALTAGVAPVPTARYDLGEFGDEIEARAACERFCSGAAPSGPNLARPTEPNP